jgi:hypothetical protein
MTLHAWHGLQRPDRRDGFLILIGVLSLILGYSYSLAHVSQTVHLALRTATEFVPLRVLAAGWLIAGGYCILAALTRRPIGGFTVAVIMPTGWGTAYFVGWLNGDVGRGWVTAVLFWALAGAVFEVAGLVDPTPIATRTDAAE